MILYQWRGAARNFGDELNSLLWPSLLPGFFDQDPRVRFLGIGSVLDGRHDRRTLKLVAGSGYGGYEAPIALDATWKIHWVRGRRTARLLGLPPMLGLGDPASLLPLAGLSLTSPALASPLLTTGPPLTTGPLLIGPLLTGAPLTGPPLAGLTPIPAARGIGFMPHFESAMRGAWREASAAAGVTLIDPRGDPLAVLAAIARCDMLISEALHGVIVADALRVPWIAIEPLAPIHRPKWRDWAETLDLDIVFQRLPPSTALERAHLSGVARFHLGRCLLTHQARRLRVLAQGRYMEQAAEALRVAMRAEPSLSHDAALERGQTRMMEAVEVLRRMAPAGMDHGHSLKENHAPGTARSGWRERHFAADQGG